MKRFVPYIMVALLLGLVLGCTQTVSDKKVVQMKYKGTLADGTEFTSSDDAGSPLEFMVGTNNMNITIEKAIMGMKVGEKKKIDIKAADAYGEYDKDALQEVPKELVPEGAKVGMELQVQGPTGPIPVKIVEIRSKTVMVDFNHPLAGKDLTFEVEIVKIRDATKEELTKALSTSETVQEQ
jgi:FKBP-type peptidyl-prolyl cis-trans isomerase 2